MDIAGGLVGMLTRTPFVLSERSSALNYSGGWKSKVRLYVGKFAAAIVANSEGGRSYWKAHDQRSRCVVIGNAIPFAELERAPR